MGIISILPPDNTPDDVFPRINYSSNQLQIIRIIALVFDSLSIIACLVCFFWYLNLKRKAFRHELVVFLVLTDFLRTCFALAYDVITFTNMTATASYLTCQVLGFFTAFFIECSDFVIFAIAIHTTVFVLYPNYGRHRAEGGIWTARLWVYASIVLLSGLLAGLAFVNTSGPAYVPLLTWCFLPARPVVWRMALSWGPRYFIIISIFILYIILWDHVRRLYKGFGSAMGPSSSSNLNTSSPHISLDPPHSPTSRQPTHTAFSNLQGNNAVAARHRTEPETNTPLAAYNFGRPASSPSHRHETFDPFNVESNSAAIHRDTDALPVSADTNINNPLSDNSGLSAPAQDRSDRRPSAVTIDLNNLPRRHDDNSTSSRSSRTLLDRIFPWRRRNSSDASNASTLVGSNKSSGSMFRRKVGSNTFSAKSNTNGASFTTTDFSVAMQRRRVAALRQMGHLFIFPLIYLLQWVFPFASQIVQLSGTEVTRGLFVLQILTNIFLPSQGLINVAVYAAKERPWRLRRNSSVGGETPPTGGDDLQSPRHGSHYNNEYGSGGSAGMTFAVPASSGRASDIAYARRQSEILEAKHEREIGKRRASVGGASLEPTASYPGAGATARRASLASGSEKSDKHWWEKEEQQINVISRSGGSFGSGGKSSSPPSPMVPFGNGDRDTEKAGYPVLARIDSQDER